jgi:hypothetical protein
VQEVRVDEEDRKGWSRVTLIQSRVCLLGLALRSEALPTRFPTPPQDWVSKKPRYTEMMALAYKIKISD